MAYGDTAIWGPMYRELGDPASLGEDLREAARIARAAGEADPLGLYNLHWMDDLGEVTAVVLPSDLTGVSTRIALLLGEKFPAGQAHSGAAYAMLTERQLHEEIAPRDGRLIVPSTGAFGLGAAWVARTMGYSMTAVLPSSAVGGRGPALRALGAEVIVGGAGPADVLDLIDAAWAHKSEGDAVLSPYDDFAPYRYHASVTAGAIRSLSATLALPDQPAGRLAAFVAPTGAGALLAAGDDLPGVAVVAAEPQVCAPLADGSWEAHAVADAGPRFPGWTDHVTRLDAAVAVADEDLAAAIKLFAQPAEGLAGLGLRESTAQRLSGACGPAACLALVAAIKTVRFYGFGSTDLVVAVAPEGSTSRASDADLEGCRAWAARLRGVRSDGFVEASTTLRRRWHHQKYGPWVERRGKGADALRRQQDEDFWAEQRRRREAIDGRIFTSREAAAPV